jgi:hypothetical protein
MRKKEKKNRSQMIYLHTHKHFTTEVFLFNSFVTYKLNKRTHEKKRKKTKRIQKKQQDND